MREIEVKLPLEDADDARRRLGLAGAVAETPRQFEDNRLYDDAAGSLAAARRILRLRSTAGRHLVTFKAPDEGNSGDVRCKVRIEHQTTVEDAEEFDRLLQALGYRPIWRYQKFRQSYRLGAVHADLDETPIGVYLELEGLPAEIDAAAAALGFAPADYVASSYRALFEHRGLAGDMVFPPHQERA